MSAPTKTHIAIAVTDHLPGIQRLAREYDVARLEVYGDAVVGELPSRPYPVVFIVTYPPGYNLGPWGGRWTELAEELGHMVGRYASLLISTTPADDPVERDVMEQTRQTLYVTG